MSCGQPNLKARVRAHLRRQFGAAAAAGEMGEKMARMCVKAIAKMNAGQSDAVISTTDEDGKLTAERIVEEAKLWTLLTKH